MKKKMERRPKITSIGVVKSYISIKEGIKSMTSGII